MKYLAGVIAAVVVLMIAIVLIITRDAPSTTDPNRGGKKAVQLADYLKQSATVTFTRQGPLVGEEQRRAVRISVNPSVRTVEVLEGYDQRVIKSESYTNTQAAYETFLKGLENAGYARERDYEPKDERGICPLGNRFIYELQQGSEQKLYTWSTSCSAKQGTFAGTPVLIRQLFENQIPDFSKFISGGRI